MLRSLLTASMKNNWMLAKMPMESSMHCKSVFLLRTSSTRGLGFHSTVPDGYCSNGELHGPVRTKFGEVLGTTWMSTECGRRSAMRGKSKHFIGSRSHANVPPSLESEVTTDPIVSQSDQEHYKRELNTINVAIAANVAILFAKTGAFYFSMSSSMFAEAIHSLADVGNQILLRKGAVQALKKPTAMYPYGFSRDKFVWSLMSAVGIFFLGAGVSVFNGIQGLIQPREVLDLTIVFYVLGGSFVLEGISFLVALRTVTLNAAKRGMKVFDYVWFGKDPTPIAVLLEDSGAVIGIAIAGVCTALSSYTGSSLFDSFGSIAVGVLMGGVATFLIRMNRSFLIGRSIGKKEMAMILQRLKQDSVVKNVYDFKSEEIGPGKYRLKAEIDFSGEAVVDRHLQSIDQAEVYQQLRHASWTADDQALNMVLKDYGKELVSQVGAEVDRLEAEIRKLVPGVVHVDLEVDRGKIEKKFKGNGVKFVWSDIPSAPTDGESKEGLV